jgi:hypothetical protein
MPASATAKNAIFQRAIREREGFMATSFECPKNGLRSGRALTAGWPFLHFSCTGAKWNFGA